MIKRVIKNILLFLLIFSLYFVCICSDDVEAKPAGSEGSNGVGPWTLEIYNTDRDGRTSYEMKDKQRYPSGTSCLSVSGNNVYDVYYTGNDVNSISEKRTFYHTDEGNLVQYSDSVLRTGDNNSPQCNTSIYDEKSDYWLVMTSSDGVVFSHRIDDGMNSLSIDFENREISYNIATDGKKNVYLFGSNKPKEDSGGGVATKEDLKDIYFTISDSGKCDEMSFDSGATEYVVSFKSIEGDLQGYSKTVNGAVSISDGTTVRQCNYIGTSKGHTLSVHGSDSSASIEIPDMVDSFTAEVDVVNGEITMKIGAQQNSSGTIDTEPETTVVDSSQNEPTCLSSGGAMSLGWIICPIMEWLGSAAEGAYTSVVEPMLRVDTRLFSGGNEGARAGWETFRSIANIGFIILLLVVIFSQLTGVGIDNYGIKKILPKLIVVAVLINLSYLLCIICVDLSNILGNSLRSLFDSLGDRLGKLTLDIPQSDVQGVGVGATVLTGVGILGILVFMVGAIWRNPFILLSMLVAALGVAISVFFLFVLLAVREAAIVVLVVVSPLAVACYMLPNTKKLFDRWLKLFQGLLLVYPICGLLIGGGNYISKLLLSSDFAGHGFLEAFTAMIVGIVPIFFIPTVLKGSFAAMGKVGGMLTGMGDRARKGATSMARNSEKYKNAQRMGLERRNRIRAGLDTSGHLTKRGERKYNRLERLGNGRLSRIPLLGRGVKGIAGGMTKSKAAQLAQAKKDIRTSEEAGAALSGAVAESNIPYADEIYTVDKNGNIITDSSGKPELLFKTKRDSYYADRFFKAAATGDTKALNSAMLAAQNGGMSDTDIAKMIRHANNIKALDRLGKNKSSWLLDQAKNNSALGKDVEMRHWANNGGEDELGDYGDYASAHMDATDIDEKMLAGAHSDSMAGLIKAKDRSGNRLVDAGMAEQALNIGGLTPEKQVMLGAVKDGKVDRTSLDGMNARDLKSEAKSWATGGVGVNGLINATSGDVEKWTAPVADRVTIDQQKTNEVPVYVTGSAPISGGSTSGASVVSGSSDAGTPLTPDEVVRIGDRNRQAQQAQVSMEADMNTAYGDYVDDKVMSNAWAEGQGIKPDAVDSQFKVRGGTAGAPRRSINTTLEQDMDAAYGDYMQDQEMRDAWRRSQDMDEDK